MISPRKTIGKPEENDVKIVKIGIFGLLDTNMVYVELMAKVSIISNHYGFFWVIYLYLMWRVSQNNC